MTPESTPQKADDPKASVAETLLTGQGDTDKVSIQHVAVQTRRTALERMRTVFGELPGVQEALTNVTIEEPESLDTAPVVSEVINRLMTLPSIAKMVGENRDRLESVVGHTMNGGMRSVGGTNLNMAVLADTHNKRFGLLTPIGSGTFGYVADAALENDLVSPDAKDPYGHPDYAVKMLIDTGVDHSIFQRFWSERTTLEAVQGGAPQVYADGQSGGRPYFIMRNIRGMDFRGILDSINSSLHQSATQDHISVGVGDIDTDKATELTGHFDCALNAAGESKEHVAVAGSLDELAAGDAEIETADSKDAVLWPSQWMHLSMASISQTMHEIHYPKGATEVVTEDARLSQLKAADETANFKESPVGVVHRDLKPENIRVDTEGRVWILDFGLVRSIKDDDRNLTMTGQVMGTPHYMAPEYIQDSKRNTTTKTDVYALGCMAFQMFTGSRPFEHTQKVTQVLMDHQLHYPNFDLIQNPRAKALVQRMMHKDPTQRPELAEAATEFHAIFLEGVDEAQRAQYAKFLSLPHVDRKLPVPDELESFGVVHEETGEGSSKQSLNFTRSVLKFGGDEMPEHDPSMPEVYVVGRGGKPVRLTRTVRLQRWLKKNPIVTGVAAAAGVVLVLVAGYAFTAGKMPWSKKQGSGETELREGGQQQTVIRVTEPEFRSILREIAPEEAAEILDIEYDENGAMEKMDLLGHAVDGENIYQFAGHSTPPAQGSDTPPDCHFGLCYLNEDDIANLLGVSVGDLPDSLRLKNLAAVENADGTKRKEQVSGSYVHVYDIGGKQYAVVQGLGMIIRDGNEVHVYSALSEVNANSLGGGVSVHSFETIQEAMAEGYRASQPIANFPSRMQSLNDVEDFGYMPTSTMPTDMWARSAVRVHKKGIERALAEGGQPQRSGRVPTTTQPQ
jgi:serine/threonine protein kinase